MGKRKKQLLSLLLALLMVLSSSISVFATEVEQNEETDVAYNTSSLVGYDNLQEALHAASEGQTVAMVKDVQTTLIMIPEKVTLDLNGCTLDTQYVTCYGHLVDYAEENDGLLKVAPKRILIKATNAQMPVKTEEGYKFITLEKWNVAYQADKSKYAFQPIVEAGAHELLLAGAKGSGITINVRVSWKQANGMRSQDFVYTDNFVADFLNSYKAETGKYTKMFTLTLNGTEGFEDLTFSAVMVSETGVENVSEITKVETNDDTQEPDSGEQSGNVTTDENNQVTDKVTIGTENASAVVAEGTQLEANTTELKLKATDMDATTSDVTLGENEEMRSLDVHVEGVAADNTVPVIITLDEIAPEFLNQGNIRLYHVENGVTTEMTRVFSLGEVDEHNEYYYDIETGTLTVAMATFSEIAVVSDTTKAWEGGFDYTWYDADANELTIANADQLAAFGAIVGGMAEGIEIDSFEGKTVKLIADINLGDKESENNPDLIFYPIGYYNNTGSYEKVSGGSVISSVSSFEGTFDGNGHTISNFYQNTWEMFGGYNSGYSGTPNHYDDAMGLFGYVYGGTVKNLTVSNFSSDGEFTPTGVIAAYADGDATFENIALTNCNPRVYNTGNGGIVGVAGDTSTADDDHITLKNITVDNSNKISALWGSYDVACGGLVGMYRGNVDGSGNATGDTINFENCHVSAIIDVYNDVCANYQYYAYRYAGMIIGSVRHNTTNEDKKTIPNMTGISATGCTVNYGDWNDYYYCEFEKNSMASYSEDYQFSRVPHSELKFTDSNGNGVVDADERASVIGCKHNHTAEENHQAIYLPFHQLFTGYSWGVSSIGLKEYSGIVTDLGITEGGQENSVVKFEKAETAKDTYTTGEKVAIGELFKEADLPDNVEIDVDNVQVTISPVGDSSTAGGAYTPNTTDWAQGTITFTGLGAAQIIITDYNFCEKTVLNVTIEAKQDVKKFETKFTGDFLYRVGNQNEVSLDSLFKAEDGAEIGTVSVTVEAINGTSASGTYTPNATWTEGTIQFSGTGVVKVTITDNDNCVPKELILEVVDAVNATKATSATANNVVLLNDIGGGFTVSGRYTVYGNGFTLNYTGNGQYLNNGLKQGVVTVSENGTLDNLRITASIYPAAYLYYGKNIYADAVQDGPSDGNNRYYYQLSAVAAKDNATISNCYIYGGRNNIFVNTGDVTITDSVLECGVVANVQIQSNSSHTITFNNVTTIQYQENPTLGDTSLVMLGAGVLVGPETTENPTIVLNGDFKQYNWVNSDDAEAVSNSMAEAIINGALDATAYNHTVNGKTASNLGIIYMNTEDASVTNNTELTYVLGDITIKMLGNNISGQACSIQNATDEQISSDTKDANRDTDNGYYEPQFKYSANLGGQYIEKTDDGDEHCYREGDTIYVVFPSGDAKEFDLAGLVDIVKYTGQDLGLVVTCKDENGNSVIVTDGKITLSNAGEYTVTYAVTDTLFYDKDGETVTKIVDYSWNVTVSVSLKDTAIPDARFEFDATKQKMGYYKPSFGDVKQYLPFLAGLKIYDYNGKTEYLRFDGSSDFNKVASITITGYASNKASVEVKLTDGGVINTQFLARANSGGASTYTGKIKTSGNTIYFVNDGGTSNKDTTTTAAYWYVDYYKFTGNNGVAIQSGQQTFNSTGSSASTPSGNFSTTIKYTVTYDANSGNCGQTTGYATSASVAVVLPTPTRSGYMFVGWYTAADGGTKVGGAGENYTPTANITLFAQWGKPSTVTYDANGGSCDTTSEKYTGAALTLPTPTRDEYWCTGWYDAAAGGNKIGDVGAKYQATGDITLYAQWSPVYTVTYNANEGSVTPALAEYKGTALELPMPTREGYAFNGWYTAASGGTKVEGPYTPTANITLYAQWKDPVVVTYDANGGSCDTASDTYLGKELTLPTPENRTGYTFNGWYTAASGGIKIGDFGASYTPDANITLYAQWSKTSYTITVRTTNATVSGVENGQIAYYGDTITFTVTYSGDSDKKTIVQDANGNTVTTTGSYTFTMPASDVTISASSSCITADTLITLADGSQVRVDSLVGNEELLVWNMETGELDTAPILFIDSDPECEYDIVHLYFSDGTDVKVIYEHGFWDYDLNKYVYLDAYASKYIGHTFAKQNGAMLKKVELVDVVLETEYTSAWSPVTAGHLCYFVNGMLSMPGGVDGLFNIFDVDPENMIYDYEAMERDIEVYGLFTYEELNAIEPLTREMFDNAGGKYLKVSIGKGNMTMDDLTYMIRRYSGYFE